MFIPSIKDKLHDIGAAIKRIRFWSKRDKIKLSICISVTLLAAVLGVDAFALALLASSLALIVFRAFESVYIFVLILVLFFVAIISTIFNQTTFVDFIALHIYYLLIILLVDQLVIDFSHRI